MPDNPIDSYQEALRKRDDATRRMETYVETIVATHEQFRGYKRSGLLRIGNLNLDGWPTRDDLLSTLEAIYDAHREVIAAWALMSDTQRIGFTPPEHL